MTAPAATVAVLAATYRAASTALRRLTYSGGRTAATTKAIDRHSRALDAAERALLDAGHKHLVGQLTAERHLAADIAHNATYGQARPELRARLHVTRAKIRKELTAMNAPHQESNR